MVSRHFARLVAGLAAVVALGGCPAGEACVRNSDCEVGSYCSSGACVTDCTPATVEDDCDPGQACSSFGMCVGGADAGSGPDAGTVDGGVDGGLDVGPAIDGGDTLDAGPPAMDGGLDGGADAGGPDAGPPDAGLRDAGFMPGDGAVARLVINEVDYDQPGVDAAEFLEVFNAGSAPANLTGLVVVFVNGSSSVEYARAVLTGTLPAGAFLVVGVAGQTLALPGGVTRIDITTGIQNGAPDGVVLWDTTRLAALDALSYEGELTVVTIDGTTISLVEGPATTLVESNMTPDSLCRRPDGTDTENAAADWMLCTTPTPGGSN